MTSPPSGQGTSAHCVQRHLDPLIKSQRESQRLQRPFQQIPVLGSPVPPKEFSPVGMANDSGTRRVVTNRRR
jgi:hypothetical protein